MYSEYELNEGELLEEIERVRAHWESLNCRLNWTNDGRSIEQLSYEMLADERRYAYLLRMAKEKDVHSMVIIREG